MNQLFSLKNKSLTIMVLVLFLLSVTTKSQAIKPENSFHQGSQWYCNTGFKKVGDKCQKVIKPENSFHQGSQWYCNTGFKKVGDKCQKVIKPENSFHQGSQWYCNTGFKKVGDKCQKVIKPENSFHQGSQWYCNTGFKKVGDQCSAMSPEEAKQQRIQQQILAARARAASREFFIDDEKFTLSEISRKCEVYRWSDNYGDVECSGSKFRVIQRKCEAYFSGKYEKTGELDCRGSELRPIERNCTATMYSDNYGEIGC